MDSTTRANRTAWEVVSLKYVREYGELHAQAAEPIRDAIRREASRPPERPRYKRAAG